MTDIHSIEASLHFSTDDWNIIPFCAFGRVVGAGTGLGFKLFNNGLISSKLSRFLESDSCKLAYSGCQCALHPVSVQSPHFKMWKDFFFSGGGTTVESLSPHQGLVCSFDMMKTCQLLPGSSMSG